MDPKKLSREKLFDSYYDINNSYMINVRVTISGFRRYGEI